MSRWICSAALACLVLATTCRADGQTAAQQKLNPLGYGINAPATLSFGFGPHDDVQPTLNFQPRIPLGLTEDWRIVTLSNVSVMYLPEPEGTTGLADTDVSLFLTPGRTEKWVWGVGPILQFPTATDTTLGTGKWSAGPTAALVYVDGPWVNGILVSQLWSFAGPRSRADVSLTQIEVQVSYTFSDNWYVQVNPTFSADWIASSSQRWVVPIGAAIGKTFKVGSQDLSLQIGAYYNVEKPTGSPDWVLQPQLSWSY